MPRLRRFLAAPAPERHLLLAAAVLLPIVRMALFALPFPTVRRLVAFLAHVPPRADSARQLPPERVAWATAAAARHLPGTWTCLVQALVLQALLSRHRYLATLRLGVARRRSGAFAAHAWVECEGRPVGAAAVATTFPPLPALEGW